MIKYVNRKPTHTFSSYKKMKERCTLKSHHCYEKYSKLGVCKEWLESYENFYNDMGERPINTTLDRIDNDKGYSKENCRWATSKQQSRNTSTNRILEFNGEKKTLTEWAEELEINLSTIFERLKRGWNIEKALLTKSLIGSNQYKMRLL